MMNNSRPHRYAAFTLVELLVVIAIIALLLGILLPSLGKAKKVAQSVACMSNMRQLGMATQSYGNDYSCYLPQPSQDNDIPASNGRTADEQQGSALWFNALDIYLAQQTKDYSDGDTAERNYNDFKQCYNWKSFPDQIVTGSFNAKLSSRTIKMNSYLGDVNNDLNTAQPGMAPAKWKFFRTTDVKFASNTVLFFDGRAWDTPATDGAIDTGGAGNFQGEELMVGMRHLNNSVNITCVDSHVENATQAIRTSSGTHPYQGWFAGPTATSTALRGPQKFNWFRLGRGGIDDN